MPTMATDKKTLTATLGFSEAELKRFNEAIPPPSSRDVQSVVLLERHVDGITLHLAKGPLDALMRLIVLQCLNYTSDWRDEQRKMLGVSKRRFYRLVRKVGAQPRRYSAKAKK